VHAGNAPPNTITPSDDVVVVVGGGGGVGSSGAKSGVRSRVVCVRVLRLRSKVRFIVVTKKFEFFFFFFFFFFQIVN
jgi:hypothetical protein